MDITMEIYPYSDSEIYRYVKDKVKSGDDYFQLDPLNTGKVSWFILNEMIVHSRNTNSGDDIEYAMTVKLESCSGPKSKEQIAAFKASFAFSTAFSAAEEALKIASGKL